MRGIGPRKVSTSRPKTGLQNLRSSTTAGTIPLRTCHGSFRNGSLFFADQGQPGYPPSRLFTTSRSFAETLTTLGEKSQVTLIMLTRLYAKRVQRASRLVFCYCEGVGWGLPGAWP